MKKNVRFFYWFSVFLAFGIPVLAQDEIKDEVFQPDKTTIVSAENDEEKSASYPRLYSLRRGDKEVSVEYGISPLNPSNFAGPKEFDVYGRDLHLFTMRFARVIGTKRNVSYQYMFGVTPLAVFRKNEVVNTDFVSPTAPPFAAPTKRETSYGTGFQPVNFKLYFSPKTA